ncbi:MAG: hypothetical protein U0Q19_06945 [Kineosporiaceae bacterium]
MTSDGELDHEALVESVASRLGTLRSRVRSSVHTAVSSSSSGTLLTLTLADGSVLTPSLTPTFAGRLVSYLRGTGDVRSAAVERIALDAARTAIEDFYTTDETIAALGAEVVRQIDVNPALRAALTREFAKEGLWLAGEAKALGGPGTKAAIVGRATDAATHAMSSALHTAGGQAVAGVAMKALMLPSVKAALVKAILVAAHNIAFQKALAIAVKKVGVAVMAQVLLAKAAAAGGGAAVPGIGWIVTGAILAVLTYDYLTLPEKLGTKVADELANSLADRGNALHLAMVAAFGESALEAIRTNLGTVR